jgi:glycosyltransferase involved in cell wall biosynthesis
LIAWATARLTGVRYCVSLHADYDRLFTLDGARGAPTLLGRRSLIRPLEMLTLRGAARVLPIRASLAAYAIARGVRRENIRVVPHGIDLAAFRGPLAVDVRARFNLPPDKAIVAVAGRLSPENYVSDMLDAAARLASTRDDFVLVLAGGGVLEDEVAARIRADARLARVVRPIGFVSRETVHSLRRTCAVSLCLMGGFSLIEACAAGRPVIAYDVQWHGELVVDGSTGRLIPEHDVAGVAAAIGDLLDDEPAAAALGRAASLLAAARHDIDVAAATRRQCYEEVFSL